MADDINPAVIKHTQEMLGKYVKKPSLTDKLLKKPPFRFLHDVFTVVIRDTGCFEGLYTGEELNSENIKDREDKMRFLQKMIDVVRICTNVPMTVKTSKIVAGHEPEKTNELLQLMAKIIENKLNWQPAVEQVIKGKETKTTNDKPTKDSPKEKPKEKGVAKPKESSKTNRTTSKATSKQPPVSKEDKTKRPKEKEKTVSKDKSNAKATKSEDKSAARKTKDSSKSKMAKADSQTSNKSISPNKEIKQSKQETSNKSISPNKEIKPSKLETATPPPVPCNHDENPSEMDIKRKTSILKELSQDNLDSMTKEITNNKEDLLEMPSAKEEEQETKQSPNNTSAKSRKTNNGEPVEMSPQRQENNSRKSSAKSRKTNNGDTNGMSPQRQENNSRKSSAKFRKTNNGEPAEMSPQRQENNSRKSSAKSRKSIDLGSNTPGEDKSLEKVNHTQIETPKKIRNSPEKTEKVDLTKEEEQQPTPPPAPSPKQPTPTGIINNEVKRESTFTREDSKELPSKLNRPRTSLRPPSARPPSARPGAPRRRDRNVEIILQPNDQVKMSGIQVKLETFGDLDDDGENLVIIENANTASGELTDDMDAALTKPESGTENEMLEQGHLVQQILETQKELTQQKDFNQQVKSDKESINGMVMKQTSMNNLRDVIQGLTKSVNPLGKLMDFIPEDIDAMQLEFTMWRDAYTQAANQLKREKSLTESATEPMKNQLIQIEANIQEYLEMIDASRVKILQNNDKILKMLTSS